MGGGSLPVFAGLVCLHALVQIICVWTGAMGLPLTQSIAILAAVISVALSVFFASRFLPAASRQCSPPDIDETRSRLSIRVSRLAGGAAVLWLGIVWVILWVLAYHRPPYDWDGLYYHLPAIHGWARAGHVAWLDSLPDVPFVNFPMGVETTTFFVHRILRTSRLVDACNLWYWPLACLAVVLVATRLGARGIWRWLAGGLIIGAPVFVSQSASCYVDPGFAACVMAAVAASCLVVFEGTRRRRWTTALWGGSVGLVLGAKGTGPLFASVFFGVVLVGGLLVRGQRRWREWLRQWCVAGCVTLAVGGYWTARAVCHAGNPAYPIQVKLGEKVLFEGHAEVIDPTNLPDWLEKIPAPLRVPAAWLQRDAPIRGFDPIGGMGYLWLVAALPAIAIMTVRAVRRRSRGWAKEYGFVFALVALLLAVQPAAWWARFTVWLHVLGLASLAVVLQWGVSESRRQGGRVVAVIGLLVAVGVAIWESNRTLGIEWRTGRLAQPAGAGAAYETTAGRIFPGMTETPGFDRALAAAEIARSRLAQTGALLGGVLSLPLGDREIHVLSDEPGEAELLRLRERGVSWVLWDVASAGEVPALLRRVAIERHVYNPGDEVNIQVLRLPSSTDGERSTPDGA